MNLHFKGTITKQEYVDIITLISNPVKSAPRGTIAQWIPSIILMIAGAVVGIGTLAYGATIRNALIIAMAMVPIVFAVLILSSMRPRKRISPTAQAEVFWRNEANRKLVIEGTVTDEGILMKTSAGESLMRWEGFAGYGEYNDIVVLIQPTRTFLSIPKRFFEKPEDWATFRNAVGDKLNMTHRVDGSGDGHLPAVPNVPRSQ